MSSLYLPNPCLLGIMLCISTHDGNHLVFHYPPKPGFSRFRQRGSSRAQKKAYSDTGSTASISEDDEWDENPDREAKSDDEDGSDESEEESDDEDNDYRDGEGYYDNRIDYSESSYGRLSTYSTNGGRSDIDRGADNKESGDTLVPSVGSSVGSPLAMASTNEPSVHQEALRGISASRSGGGGGGSISLTSSPILTGSAGTTGRTQRQRRHVHKIEKLFGFDIDFISEMVSPPKALCNNRFELTVEDIAFLGLPIHIGDDGNWRPSHHRHGKKSSKHKHKRGISMANTENTTADTDDAQSLLSADEDGRTSSSSSASHCPMYLFNLVFVMDPPMDEYNYRIDEMYHYVISRLALLLRYEQQKTNYVWEESDKIMKLKEEAVSLGFSVTEQWGYVIEHSSLANVIRQTFEAMKHSDIVNVNINGKFSSFQIPIRTEFNMIPPKHVRVLRGSSLSSISPFNNIIMDPVSGAGYYSQNEDWMVYFALLLLDDPEAIIRDIRAEEDSLIANFIRMIKPSESLSRLSTLSGLDITEVKLFASHLVYWRRAKATLPIAPKNIYIVSPLAPMDRVYSDSVMFIQNFPNLPPLCNFLSLISTNSNRPRPVSTIIPSRDHRDLYMDAIAWLLKHGYLTQLYTFLWLKIKKEIKIRVDEELEMERKRRQSMKKKKKKRVDDNTEVDENVVVSEGEGEDEEEEEEEEEEGTKSLNGEGGSKEGQAEGGDVKVRNTDNTTKKDEPSGRHDSHDSRDSRDSNGNGISSGSSTKVVVQFEEEEEEDTILQDPESSTALERRWIAKCVEGKPVEVVNLFYKLLKYMNGKSPLELFILKENVSRQDVRRLLSSMGDQIVTSRHW
ncbi:DEKNAAC101005 [Brettanomyces naardenensis]|uniref:Nitrogen permease regulator 3 n=1 Tax=Brettanomyces naardenensis TaxID=13370 RepID=A0A448YGS4_BRENA|nr:DEKNAAC101005 [Brettanomyces naardenensis]